MRTLLLMAGVLLMRFKSTGSPFESLTVFVPWKRPLAVTLAWRTRCAVPLDANDNVIASRTTDVLSAVDFMIAFLAWQLSAQSAPGQCPPLGRRFGLLIGCG